MSTLETYRRDPDTLSSATARTGTGRVQVVELSRTVPLSRSAFAIPAVLPLLVISFVGFCFAVYFHADTAYTNAVCGGLIVLATGLLLIPALAPTAELEINDDGIVYRQKGQRLALTHRDIQTVSAPWDRIAGVTDSRTNGLVLEAITPHTTRRSMHAPGGFVVGDGLARLPLNRFGARKAEVLSLLQGHLSASQLQPVRNRERRGRGMDMTLLLVSWAICIAAVIVAVVVLNP